MLNWCALAAALLNSVMEDVKSFSLGIFSMLDDQNEIGLDASYWWILHRFLIVHHLVLSNTTTSTSLKF
jgi:hypothetical protein